ncbi:8155_t:CDS:1 [Diversispora eburnea]|uniref:8155_t:CDS:1 n=1 Tax=Diversispora eburnea TaxID=1213867 RepID=A0A9N9CIM4_9GLOM|nr:8155_t:CDS:1 [Diversispora eburnea]
MEILNKLQEPIPQYVSGTFPAIATIGAAPFNSFRAKLLWIFRILGCPFTGLTYFCNVKNNDPLAMCAYWLPSENFEKEDGKKIPYRPFGHYAMELSPESEQYRKINECVAKSSVLERLGSLATAYFILVGTITAIAKLARVSDRDNCSDWTYLPILLSWTLPAIVIRTIKGKIVVFDPSVKLVNEKIIASKLSSGMRSDSRAHILITAVASITIPWITVAIAYFTPPVSFACRSKFLTIFCSIWSFNNTIAYISHIVGEKTVRGRSVIHSWFCFSGIVIAFLLVFLGILSNGPSWWVTLFGKGCDVSSVCTNG